MSRQTINALYRFTHDLMKRANPIAHDAVAAPTTKPPAADAPVADWRWPYGPVEESFYEARDRKLLEKAEAARLNPPAHDDRRDIVSALVGGGAGALAGYGLGSAFQDEDDDSQPWLSTLAGTAAGGVGLPMLMRYLAQQAAKPAPPEPI